MQITYGFSLDDKIFEEVKAILRERVHYELAEIEIEGEKEFYFKVPNNQTDFGKDLEEAKKAFNELKNNDKYNEEFYMFNEDGYLIITYLREFM